MFATFGFDTLTAPQAALWFALGLGLVFGALAQITRFCLRRALVGEDRRQAAGVWLMALAVAVAGTQAAVAQGWITFADHRFMTGAMPLLAIVLGGLMFGAGMVLTRGCISRLTVLSGAGNLRAVLVLIVFAITAHAMMKGVLAPLRSAVGAVTVPLDPALPGAPLLWAALIGGPALVFALRSGNRAGTLVMAGLIGLLVPLGWAGTGFVLYDDFDPIAMESLSFTRPATDAIFYTLAATALTPGFGVGLVGGVIGGSFVAAALTRRFRWQSFETPGQTGRYLAGAVLMGTGGVLAGGCTVGAGLSGVPTLSLAAILALVAMGAGALMTDRLLRAGAAQPRLTPAE
ncbi:YeeE/YedE family protein [Roseovarius sp. SYSU LYC5161]|uniref:YeeE/YedE family protein n=1 Tax=Roseovarius halophilus (ex Wu et al. 2025) TaxID=3376060 RepID=UPI002870E998|nr:YeeE/YedE family protein [Roseovarius sp.]